ncbi:MAG: HD domain-containing protein [Acholeplasmatales bacterium]|nr:HD domain-containing protein [Acholeplasmatales bacterium]
MFTKLNRSRVFRDPLYGYISCEYKIIADLIDTKELQRLRRIRQLAGVGMVFQTAEHTRFTHSLGAYHMANLVIHNVDGMEKISEYEHVVFLISALLHDVGHGPYSHAFETTIDKSHEDITVSMILSPKTEIHNVLNIKEGLAEDVASVISHDGKFPLIEQLVSSQLDVDRMDYLSRDAYMTGATYGIIDYFRILRSMRIIDNKLVCKASGVHSIESYLMSRYHMYFQVYYHPVARSYEAVLESIYERIKDLSQKNYKFECNLTCFLNVINNNDDLESYLELDDAYVQGFIKQLEHSKDKTLSKLCSAILNRHLFKCIDLANEPEEAELEAIKNRFKDSDSKYFFKTVDAKGEAYKHSKKSDINDIKVLLPNGKIKSLDQYSPIIKSLVSSSYTEIHRIYYFED